MQMEELRIALDPDLLSDNLWDSIWKDLKNIQSRFRASSDIIQKLNNTPLIPFSLFQFHARVLSICKDANILVTAAHSPRLRGLFQRKFEIINLEAAGSFDHNLSKLWSDGCS